MAQLIQMRQRIQAAESTKKITQAMRLISMSTHSRLRAKKEQLQAYRQAFDKLFRRLSYLQPAQVAVQGQERHLIILVSSNKGLCGNFNAQLFKFFEQESGSPDNLSNSTHDFIGVGRYAANYLHEHNFVTLANYTTFMSLQFTHIANALTDIILSGAVSYTTVTVYSTYAKSFFIQRPQKTQLIPAASLAQELTQEEQEIQLQQAQSQDYILESSAEELGSLLYKLMLSIILQELLFESLLAEQAARFLSMDSATRNADNLIADMRLEYNKTRQAEITRELTELSSSYTV